MGTLLVWAGVCFLLPSLAASTQPVYNFPDGRLDYQAPERTARWHIPDQKLPSSDVPVAGCDVLQFGAKGDGVTDDTEAFQQALLFMARNGGGAVWVPAGRYAIRGTLVVPLNVTLRGEWVPPGKATQGSILLAYHGRGDAEGDPFLTVYPNGGVRGLTIWYPEQSAKDPVPYPWTIVRPDTLGFKSSFTVEEVTIINAWRGIRIGLPATGNGNWLLRRIYMTAIASGIETDMTNDIGRLYAVFLSPRYWRESGLPGAPRDSGDPALKRMKQKGVGITIRRHDFTHHGPFSVEGYAVGFKGAASKTEAHESHFASTGASHFQGHLYGIVIRDCVVAADLSGLHPASAVFTDSTLSGSEVGLRIAAAPEATVQLNNCEVSGQLAIENSGLWALHLFNTRVRGSILNQAGILAMTGGSIQTSEKPVVLLEASTTGALFRGVSGLRRSQIEGFKSNSAFVFNDAPLPSVDVPRDALNIAPPRPLHPSARRLLVMDELSGDGILDISSALQASLDEVATQGGGIVYLPAGFYRLDQPVRVPGGVELRGANEGPHHLGRSATVLRIFWGKGQPEGEAAISLAAGSGIRGIGFVYPEMDYRDPDEFAWTLRSLGADVYMMNISAGGVDRLIDLASFKSDRHYVNQVMANPIRIGVAMGAGSRDGRVLDCQFITHAWSLLPVVWSEQTLTRYYTDSLAALPTSVWVDEASGKRHDELLRANLRAFVMDDTIGQTLFFNFVYAALSGLDAGFEGQASGVVFSHGVDVCVHGARLRSIGSEGLNLVNYMVYGRGWEATIAVDIQDTGDGRAVFRSLQIVGPQTHAVRQLAGRSIFEQPLFSVPGRQGLLFEGGSADLLAPSFFHYDASPRLDIRKAARGGVVAPISRGRLRPGAAGGSIGHADFKIIDALSADGPKQ